MFAELKPAFLITVVFTLLTGILYPLAVTGVAQVVFPHQANGSLVTLNGKEIGSRLIAQNFTKPAYFHPRPSAAGEKGYDATSSGGSNLGPTSKKLQDRINDDFKRLKSENPEATGPIPAELVTASASGLDPHLSPEAMLWQAPRVAKARGVTPERVKSVVEANVEGRTFGILGEPRVNVLLVNLALDRQFGKATALPPAPEKKDGKLGTTEGATSIPSVEKPQS